MKRKDRETTASADEVARPVSSAASPKRSRLTHQTPPLDRHHLRTLNRSWRESSKSYDCISDWTSRDIKSAAHEHEDMARSSCHSRSRGARRASSTDLRRRASQNSARGVSARSDERDSVVAETDDSSSQQSTETPKSDKTGTTSHDAIYRETLRDARIYIDVGPQAVPADIWTLLDIVFAPVDNWLQQKPYRLGRQGRQGPTKEECDADLSTRVAFKLWDDSIKKAEVSGSGEQTWNTLLAHAIKELSPAEVVQEEYAEWLPELLPPKLSADKDLEAMKSAVPQKRLRDERLEYLSPEESIPSHVENTTPPSASSSIGEQPLLRQADSIKPSPSPVRKLFPDIFVGLRNDVITQLLIDEGFPHDPASRYLRILQRDKGLLCSEPTRRSCGLRFPFLVIEGKSAATSGNIYKAENQAAGAGACALKIQADLDRLAHPITQEAGTSTSSPSCSSSMLPCFFSITTQGAIMEFWVHYLSENVQSHCFYTGRNTLWHAAQEMVRRLKAIIDWASKDYMTTVVRKLSECAAAGSGLD